MKLVLAASQHSNGKDTVCDYLKLKLKDTWKRKAFADEVKNTFCRSFEVDRDFIERWKRIDEPPPGMILPVRRALQLIGDGFRKIDPDVWVKKVIDKNEESKIISDGRYKSELRIIKNNNGFNMFLLRPEKINYDENDSEAELRPFALFVLEHINLFKTYIETKEVLSRIDKPNPNILEFFDLIDIVIINNSTLDELFKTIDKEIVPRILNYFSE